MSPVDVIFARGWVAMPCILLSQDLHTKGAIILQAGVFVNCIFMMD
jgi:hypothetical protein